jgi:tRNA U34 5-methylaminomethyl-2-thiouridine-forming methyltransferase MnmC
MTKSNTQIVPTSDGSSTIYSKRFNSHYHSVNGAVEESVHVFISAGLEYCISKGIRPIHILEIGFGSGLNAILSLIKANKSQISIEYTGYEKYPLEIERAQKLDYLKYLHRESLNAKFTQMHELSWGIPFLLTPQFLFKKIKQAFEDINEFEAYDLIYFDAFAPNIQDHLWEEEFLKRMYDALKPQGVLVSYCAKGNFKRALKTVGFSIQALNGPAGKREMTRAVKSI